MNDLMGKKKKILVVDDNRLIRRFMKELLKKEGHEVFTANDGHMALKTIIMETPDVLFIDLFMPKIGGDLLCKMIRKMPHMDDSYLVIISATLAEMEFNYRKVGADACIAKGPFGQMSQYVLAAVKASENFRDRRNETAKPIMGLGPDDEACVYPRQITKELLSRNRHLQSILDGMNEGILELNARIIIYSNKYIETIFGAPREEIIARDFLQFFDPVDQWRIKGLFNYQNRENPEISADNPISINGRQVAIRTFIRKGKIASTIVLMTDVTKQQCRIFQKSHAEELHAVSVLTRSIAGTLNTHIREMGQVGETLTGACGKDTPFALKMERLGSYARAMKNFSCNLTALADENKKTCDDYDTPIKTGKERILICDGDSLSLQFNRLTLEALGYQVKIAKTGENAIAKYLTRHGKPHIGIDLVVADSKLPDISSAELTDKLRRIDSEVKILITCDLQEEAGSGSDGDQGCSLQIQKPFNIRVVSEAVRDALDQ